MNAVRLTRRLWRLKGHEPWHHAVFLTYGANLIFFEGAVWPELPPVCGTVVLLADETEYLETCDAQPAQGIIRHVNQRYVFDGISVRGGVAHGKMILLTSPDAGRLLVGSGNVGAGGYLSGGELFVEYEYHDDDGSDLGAFHAARDLLQRLVDESRVGEVAAERITHILSQVPWLYGAADGRESPLRHNLDDPFAAQLERETAGERVTELVVLAPFFDEQAKACSDLLERLRPEGATIYVHTGTSVSPDALALIKDSYPGDVNVRLFSKADASYVHAKAYLVRLEGRELLLTGSPNLTQAAMLRTPADGNLELASLLHGEPGSFDGLFSALGTAAKIAEISELPVSFKPVVGGAARDVTLLRASWTGQNLQIDGRGNVPAASLLLEVASARFSLGSARPQPEGASAWSLTVSVNDDLAGLLARPVSIRLAWAVGAEGFSTNAVFPCNVKRITAESSRSVAGSGSGVFEGVEFGDTEFERLLYCVAELAIDSVSLREMAGHRVVGNGSGDEDVEGQHFTYGELQIKELNQHPRLRQYDLVRHGGGRGTTPAELLLMYIDTFYAAFVRGSDGDALGASGPSGEAVLESGQIEELIDGDVPQAGAEETLGEGDASALDEGAIADEKSDQEKAEQYRDRMLQRLIDRYLRGLASPEFLHALGYERVSQNYAAFNHVFWRLASLGWLSADYLSNAAVSALGIYWGDAERPGIFSEGAPDSRSAIGELLTAQHDVPTVLALLWYVANATDVESAHSVRGRARDVLHGILIREPFRVTAEDWDAAGSFITAFNAGAPTECDLGQSFSRLANFVNEDELIDVLTRDVGAWCQGAYWSNAKVKRPGTGRAGHNCLCISSSEALVTQDQAEKLIRVLLRVRPGVEYLHCVSPDTDHHDRVAIYDRPRASGGFWNKREASHSTPLVGLDVDVAPWASPLTAWLSLASKVSPEPLSDAKKLS